MSCNGEPVPGFVYFIRIADDPARYRAMCLRAPDKSDDMIPMWFVFDYGQQGSRLTVGRYVVVEGVDAEHAVALWSAFMPCGMFA